MTWTASKVASWVTLSATGGTLAAGATATVTASIGTGANSLAAGGYTDTVTFTNTTNGTGNTTRPVSLTVTAAVSLSSLAISGAASVNEGATSTYSATATWNDGTTMVVTPIWSVTSGPATISSAGVLTASSVTATAPAVINASYTSGGVTRTSSVTVSIVNVPATLSSIAISGAASVNEGATSTYTATATWSDGTTTNVTSLATWSTNQGTISTSGVLSAPAVTANQTATIGASYTSGGVTRTASVSVTIVNVPAPAGAIIPTPPDGTRNVPVNTVITARVTGTTGISTLFNKDTFTLKPTVGTGDSSEGPTGPLAAGVCVSGGIVQGSFAYNPANTSATFTPNCDLAYGETYDATVSSNPQSWQFMTIPAGPDSDGDGVQDAEDDDPLDGKKASPPSPNGTGKFHIEVTGSPGILLTEALGISDTNSRLAASGKPEGYEFRDGLSSFKVVGLIPGGTVTVVVTFPSDIPAGSKVYKVDANGFHEVVGAVVNGNAVTMTLTDGGQGDSDGQVNGIIVDPVGVAAPAAPGTGSIDLSSGSGGGCSVAVRTGSGGSDIDGTLILAGLGLTVWGIRIRRRRG